MALLLFGKPVVFWTAFAISVFGLLAVYVFRIYQKYWELQGVPLMVLALVPLFVRIRRETMLSVVACIQ